MIPTLKPGDILCRRSSPGDILGHPFMGEVVEVGTGANRALKVGDLVVVPFTIAFGSGFFCSSEL